MKILMILGKDVHNKPAVMIYRECLKRGHRVEVYAIYMEEMHIKCFAETGALVRDYSELNKETIETFDYIYAAVPLYFYPLFRTIKKYIFTNPTTFLCENYFCNDFTFTARDVQKDITEGQIWGTMEANKAKLPPCMATGLAHHDGLKELPITDSHTILIIDAGHFPFGTKDQLAEFILQIAKHCSEYKIRIKPRYMQGDKSVTHRNDEFLENEVYRICDGRLPDNIEFIEEHTTMKEEIEKAYLVICPEVTTSFFEAAMAKRRILIFEGFPNKENGVIDKKSVQRFNIVTKGSGGRIPYHKIFDYLPNGLMCKEDYIENMLYKTDGITMEIVDTMEYIYLNFISQNRFPAEEFYYSDDYKRKMQVDDTITWNEVIQRRYRNCFYNLVACDTWLCADLDFTPVLHFIENTKQISITEQNFEYTLNQVQLRIYDIIIKNQSILMDSAFSQSCVLDALYKKGLFFTFPEGKVLCKGYYAYVLAKYQAEHGGDMHTVLNNLEIYFDEIQRNKYVKTKADEDYTIACAYYYRGIAYYHLQNYRKSVISFKQCMKIMPNHQKAKDYLNRMGETGFGN